MNKGKINRFYDSYAVGSRNVIQTKEQNILSRYVECISAFFMQKKD